MPSGSSARPKIRTMFAAPVWHFWIAVVLMVTLVVPAAVTVIALYLNKVVKPKYPGADQERA